MPNRNKVFVSYSQKDKSFLDEIKRHFKPFLNKIDFWDDSKILPGQLWRIEIEKALHHTKVAILLVSTDFLGSEFITQKELPVLLNSAENDEVSLLIVILRPCMFEAFSDLKKYQAMNSPDNPVVLMTSVERENLYVNLVRRTSELLNS